MTFAAMKCDPAETSRRMDVCVRINLLWDRLQGCEDQSKRKRIERELRTIKANESHWLKQAAFFLY